MLEKWPCSLGSPFPSLELWKFLLVKMGFVNMP